MFGITDKSKELILHGELIEFIEDEYGEVTESIPLNDTKLLVHFIPSDKYTILFTTGLSLFQQANDEIFNSPFRIELIAYLPQGIPFDHVSKSARYEFISTIVEDTYKALNDGKPIIYRTIYWADSIESLIGFNGAAFLFPPMEPSVCRTNIGKVEFLSITPLYKEEQEFFSAHDFVNIEKILLENDTPIIIEPDRKMIDIDQALAQSEKLPVEQASGQDSLRSSWWKYRKIRGKNTETGLDLEGLDDQLLDPFGSSLMTDVRDKAINRFERVINEVVAEKDEKSAIYSAVKSLNEEQMSLFISLIPYVVDTTLHYFFQMLNRDEEVEVVINIDDDTSINIKDICSDLSQEMFSENGWVERFSESKS